MRVLLITLSLSSATAAGLNDQPIWQTGIVQAQPQATVPVPHDQPVWIWPEAPQTLGLSSAFVRGEAPTPQQPGLSGTQVLPQLHDQPEWQVAPVTTPVPQEQPILVASTPRVSALSQPTRAAQTTSPVVSAARSTTPSTPVNTATIQRAAAARVPAPQVRPVQTSSAPAPTAQPAAQAKATTPAASPLSADPGAISGHVPGPWKTGTPDLRLHEGGGISRLQVQLPPGTRWSLTPGRTGFELLLSGAWSGALPTAQWKRTAEVTDLIVRPVSGGWKVNLATAAPPRTQGSWRLITPQGPQVGGGALLALDLSPALGERRPLPSSDLQVKVQGLSRPIFVTLDPGHGGRDPGAVGRVTEKQVVFDVASRAANFLRAQGVTVRLTRDADRELSPDKATDLWLRSQMGRGQHAFVSIHANAMPPANILKGYGTETWYMGRNAGFAQLLQSEMSGVAGTKNLGVKSRTLGVLATNPAPSALVEIGFVSHPVDGENLQNDAYLSRVALGIARGVMRQVGLPVHPLSPLPIKPETNLAPLPPMPVLLPLPVTVPVAVPVTPALPLPVPDSIPALP